MLLEAVAKGHMFSMMYTELKKKHKLDILSELTGGEDIHLYSGETLACKCLLPRAQSAVSCPTSGRKLRLFINCQKKCSKSTFKKLEPDYV